MASSVLNDRERFLRIMRYEPVDRLPVIGLEPYEQAGIERWRTEGLPADQSPADCLGMGHFDYIPVSQHPIPLFDERIISDDGEYIVRKNTMGATLRCHKNQPATFYGHIDHPVKTRRDWDEYKELFRADSPGRLPRELEEQDIRRLNESENPVGFCFFPFFFRLGFYAMGMERFLTAFYEEPDLIHDMFAYWSDFVLELIRPIVKVVKADFAVFNEDLAGKNGPLVSPRTYAEFWYPHQDPIIRLLREHDVPVICQWSAGQFDVLLPSMMEHGFNCTWPLELMAGMSGPELRSRYGRKLLLGGNIPKEALVAGPAAIDREIDRLMPLIRQGGFIPALDDMPPLEVPFSQYRYLVEKLQAIQLG